MIEIFFMAEVMRTDGKIQILPCVSLGIGVLNDFTATS